MKLKSLLLEKSNKFTSNYYLQKILKNLKTDPGHYVIGALDEILTNKGVTNEPTYTELRDDLEALYKSVDVKAAKIIDAFLSDMDYESTLQQERKVGEIKDKATKVQQLLKKKKK